MIKLIRILYSIIVASILISGCDDDLNPQNGEPLWRVDFAAEQLASTFKPIVFDEVIVYGNDVINGTDWLIAYDKGSGDHKWSNPSSQIKNPGSSAKIVQQDEIAYIYNRGSVSALGSNGVIRWSNKIGNGAGDRNLILNEFGLFAYAEINNNWAALFQIDKDSGIENILVDYSDPIWLTGINHTHFFKKNSESYLAINVTYTSPDFQNSRDSIFLYRFNGNLELAWKDDLGPERIGGIRDYDRNLIYYSDGKYRSFDLINKTENWAVEVDPKIVGASIFILNNSLYYAESGVAVNSVTNFARRSLATGELEKRSAETYNYPLDGFVNDGENLYAARSGTILQLSLDDFSLQQEYISPDYQNNSNAFFDGAITIDHNTGEMYAANFVAALKFQLIR